MADRGVAVGQSAPPELGEATGAELSRRRAPGERGTLGTRVMTVLVPGEPQPTGRKTTGTTGVHPVVELVAPEGGCVGTGGPFGSCRALGGSPWLVAHSGVLEELISQVTACVWHGAHPW